ncbi:hypothetical protein NG701_07635 [Pseudarthrobacter sp. HLT3-5]|uniref:hypothetical protein n=1 Tax=Pseudarthrobacter cellobiosi TaxID=2953654 RepID=UPI00208F85F7|nr:hypothetical protein [Pseudarthrobacter sp. HLT3-5]MCO4274300.1 hypothetical protein [Pseudarthrobacter sp. HLT3-5]
MDSELFDLCKEVYRRTGWKMTDNYYFYAWTTKGHKLTDVTEKKYRGKGYDDVPLFTTDYLLEKLPEVLITNSYERGEWIAGTYGWYDGIGWLDKEVSDTPLKALLKLAIALDDAKELK